MRIVYLDSSRLPTEKAYGYQIMKMCEAMAGLGHVVTLVTARRETLVGEDDPFKYYEIARIFAFKRLPTINLVNVVPRFGTWLLRICFLLAAKAYLAFQKYDLLYLREQMSGIFFRGFILEVHSLPVKIRPRDLQIWKRAKKIVVLTSFIKKALIAVGVPEEKVVIAADAVDLGTFAMEMSREEARQKLGLPQDKTLLGYTGSFRTLQMDKGIQNIIGTLLLLPPNTLFVAVGGTSRDIEYYTALAKTCGVEKQVLLLPRVGLGKLAIYQKAFDALLMPFPRVPHYEFYMSPLKMFEYMAARRPIVASDLPSVREVLNERNAILIEPDNPQALAGGILKVLGDKKLAETISEQAYRNVQLFTWQNRAKIILQ